MVPEYPDILMITSPLECIPSFTLHSLLNHAPKCRTLLNISPSTYDTDEYLWPKRLRVLNQATSEYVFFFDTDDALDTSIPSNKKLRAYEAHIFQCFEAETKSYIRYDHKNITKLFGFHMVICTRKLALQVLQQVHKQKVYRDDVCFLYGVLTQAKSIKYHDTCLVMKIGQRMVKFASNERQKKFASYVKDVWEQKFKELRETT